LNRNAGAKVCLAGEFESSESEFVDEIKIVSIFLLKKNLNKGTTNFSEKFMLKTLFLIFGIGVILIYLASSWFGWEFANSGSRSRLGTPFIYGGFRGGK
jgi:hypothetical protein